MASDRSVSVNSPALTSEILLIDLKMQGAANGLHLSFSIRR